MPSGLTRRHCLRSGLAVFITLAAAPAALAAGDSRFCGVWKLSQRFGRDALTTLLTLEADGTFAAVTAGAAGYAMTASGTYRAADGILRLTVTEMHPSPDGPGRRFRPALLGAARYEFLGRDQLLLCAGGSLLLLRRIR